MQRLREANLTRVEWGLLPGGSRWPLVPGVIAVCLIPLLFYLPFAFSPFERDEGVYATVAQGLLRGELPYRDLFDNKPPLVYGWYALGFLTFGESVAAPRIMAALFLCQSAGVLFAYSRSVFSQKTAFLASGFFGLSAGLPFVGLHANTEAFMTVWLVGSLLSATQAFRTGKTSWFFLSGILIGVAIMTKQVAIWNLMTFAAAAAWWGWRLDGSPLRRAAPAAALAAAGLIPVAIAAAPYLVTGSPGDFMYANFWYNYRYVGLLSSVERVFILERSALFSLFFLALAGPWILGSLLGLVTLSRGPRTKDHVILVLFTLASALGVATGGRFYPHYFLQLTPAMAILSAVALSNMNHRWRFGAGRVAAATAGVLVLVSLITNGLLYFAPDATVQRFSESAHRQKEWEKDSRDLGDYMAQLTQPDERIFNYGREAQVYFYADRLPAAKFFYDWAYDYDEKTLDEAISELSQHPAPYIVDTVLPPLFDAGDREPQFDAFLRDQYEYVERVLFADIYRPAGENQESGAEVSSGDSASIDPNGFERLNRQTSVPSTPQ